MMGKTVEKKVAPNRVLDNKMGGTHGYRVPVCVPAQKCEASNLMPPPLKLLSRHKFVILRSNQLYVI